MSGKRSKQIRRYAERRYAYVYSKWYRRKPSRWRIFKYLKWKKAIPTYSNAVKETKDIFKASRLKRYKNFKR